MTSPKESSMKELQTINTQLKERREKIYKTYPDLRPTCDSDTEPHPKADLLADLLKVIIKDLGKTPYKEKAKKNKTLV